MSFIFKLWCGVGLPIIAGLNLYLGLVDYIGWVDAFSLSTAYFTGLVSLIISNVID